MVLKIVALSSERKRREEVKKEVASLLRDRLRYALRASNKSERAIFTEALKEHIWEPRLLLEVSNKAKRDPEQFLRDECKMAAAYKFETLADVRARSVFTQLLIVLRTLYGEDIAAEVPFRVSAQIATEEILLHQ